MSATGDQLAKGDKRPLLVGLTGGIGAGKSTVAGLFRKLGAAVVDADALARQVTRAGSEPLARIVEAFGSKVLGPDGELDREALGRLVFSQPQLRQRLEAITHPAIQQAAQEALTRLAAQGHPVVIYEAALLVETGRAQQMDQLVVVVCQDEQRIRRVTQRNGWCVADVQQRIAAQMPQDRKAALGDYVIDNSGPLEQTRQQAQAVWQQILQRLPRKRASE